MHRELCALKDMFRFVARLEETIRKQYGITLTEALVLCSIDGGCTTATNLADEVALSPSRLSRVLSSLEAKGLVSRQRRDDDRRNWDNVPSHDGSSLIERMRTDGIDVPDGVFRIIEQLHQGA